MVIDGLWVGTERRNDSRHEASMWHHLTFVCPHPFSSVRNPFPKAPLYLLIFLFPKYVFFPLCANAPSTLPANGSVRFLCFPLFVRLFTRVPHGVRCWMLCVRRPHALCGYACYRFGARWVHLFFLVSAFLPFRFLVVTGVLNPWKLTKLDSQSRARARGVSRLSPLLLLPRTHSRRWLLSWFSFIFPHWLFLQNQAIFSYSKITFCHPHTLWK